MRTILEKLLNELPTIAVGVWAILRVAGIEVAEGDRETIVTTVEAIAAAGLWLLVRRNVDGPVSLWHAKRDPDGTDG